MRPFLSFPATCRLPLLLLLPLLLATPSCRPDAPDTVPIPTRICIKTTHHNYPLAGSTVYLKYFTDTFPGYDKGPAYYDASFKTGTDARGCIESVPEGRHWLVAFGYDSLHFPHEAFGSLPVEISLTWKPELDTTLYLGH